MRLIAVSLALAAFTFAAFAAEPQKNGNDLAKNDLFQLERVQHEDIALALAPIRSQVDLDAYLRNTPDKKSPFRHLSPSARKRFLASVSFNENGITGFSYDDIENELTASQIYRVLSLFGAQHMTSRIQGARVETELDEALMEAPEYSPMYGTGEDTICPVQPCDYSGYKCVARATCETHSRYICMRTC